MGSVEGPTAPKLKWWPTVRVIFSWLLPHISTSPSSDVIMGQNPKVAGPWMVISPHVVIVGFTHAYIIPQQIATTEVTMWCTQFGFVHK